MGMNYANKNQRILYPTLQPMQLDLKLEWIRLMPENPILSKKGILV